MNIIIRWADEEHPPGTYIDGEYFPAPLCLHCLGRKTIDPDCKHPAHHALWIPSPGEINRREFGDVHGHLGDR